MAHLLHETLFIIGAGAHVPYGMPSGRQLRSKLKELYAAPEYINPILQQTQSSATLLKWSITKIAQGLNLIEKTEYALSKAVPVGNSEKDYLHWLTQFLKSFSESHVLSIDAYLANLDKEEDKFKAELFRQLGKLTVAMVIAEYEKATPLGMRDDDWIHLFIDQFVKKDPSLFFQRAPKIITFNYDRIFERMLFTHLTEYHKYSGLKAKSFIDGLNILHIYGSIGDYSAWYDDGLPSDFISNAASSIMVIGEDRQDLQDTMNKIRFKYDDCQNIYFLGYGFDETNNKLLRKSFNCDWHLGKKLYSTSIGLKNVDLNRIQKTMGTFSMIRNSGGTIHEDNCLHLLSEIAPLTLS